MATRIFIFDRSRKLGKTIRQYPEKAQQMLFSGHKVS